MSRIRVASFSISIDGFGAGPDQSLAHPLGVGGEALHDWIFPTRTLQKNLFGRDGGESGEDDNFASRGIRKHWCMDSRQEHVRSRAWAMA